MNGLRQVLQKYSYSIRSTILTFQQKIAIEKSLSVAAVVVLNRRLLTTNTAMKSQQSLEKNYPAVPRVLVVEEMEPKEGVFHGVRDRFRGITVDTNTIAIDLDRFPEQLAKSLDYWNERACRSIWFKVNISSSNIVPILAQNGFNFHHAREGFVMMVRWLPTDETSNIPPYAHTMVGVGGVVINNKNQILSIVEKQSIVPGSWKLPGGYAEPGENIIDAGIREVFEETGIKTKFLSLISIRHAHGFNFNCSDLYIVIALQPVDESIEEIVNCPREIAESKWMDFDDYLSHPMVHEKNRSFLRAYLNNRKAGIKINCTEHEHQLLRRKYHLYYVEPIAAAEPKL